jgi:sulfur carrier protein
VADYNRGMEIRLNGEAHQVGEGTTLAELLAAHGFAGRRVAVELNRAIVPRSRLDTQPLAAGDQVEIVHAIGGG